MTAHEQKRGPSPDSAAALPLAGGGATSDQERSAPLPGTDKSIPIGTPLTAEELRRLKGEAEKPGNNPAVKKDKNSDSSDR